MERACALKVALLLEADPDARRGVNNLGTLIIAGLEASGLLGTGSGHASIDALLAANPDARRGVNNLGTSIIAGMEASGLRVLAANPDARQGVNLGGTSTIAGLEEAGAAVLRANPDVRERPTGGGTAIADGRLFHIFWHGSGDGGAAGGSAAGSDEAPSWPERVPREVDIAVAGRLADVREVLISCAEGSSTDGSRLAQCRHGSCIGPSFGSLPYLVVVPAGNPLPSSHSMRDAAGAGKRACNRRLEYVTTQEAATYGNSAEFPYLPTAADIAQRKAGKK